MNNKVLIVDDEEINREVLATGLNELFEIVQASNGKEALDVLSTDNQIKAVFLDLNMPVMDGREVLKIMNKNGMISRLPVFVITSTTDEDILLEVYELGAIDVVGKKFNIRFLRKRVLNTIELYAQRDDLSKIVEKKTKELVRNNFNLVTAMANLVEERNSESGTHVKRVCGYTHLLMEELIKDYPEYAYLKDDIETISLAAALHDLGKISITDSILNKPARLSDDEFEIMQTHTTMGYKNILKFKDIMSEKLFAYSSDISLHHHERIDGKGYPEHLKGDEISIWSQVVALADVYDALTTDRCYKKAYGHEVACKMILNGECGAFNEKIIEVFKKLASRFSEIRWE